MAQTSSRNVWEAKTIINHFGDSWVAQSVKCLPSAQVMISQVMGSSLISGSVLTAQSLELTWDSVSPSLSAPRPHSPPLLPAPPLILSLSLKSK